jgi:hypothetical protein
MRMGEFCGVEISSSIHRKVEFIFFLAIQTFMCV